MLIGLKGVLVAVDSPVALETGVLPGMGVRVLPIKRMVLFPSVFSESPIRDSLKCWNIYAGNLHYEFGCGLGDLSHQAI